MISRVSDRCRNICGEPDEHCYINSEKRLNCIADLVINKTMGVSLMLDSAMEECTQENLMQYLTLSSVTINELSNWIKYLQLVQDLKELSSLELDSTNTEKRQEIRYPMPKELTDEIRIALAGPKGEVSVTVTNFSQRGLQVQSPVAMQKGTQLECVIIQRDDLGLAMHLKAEVRYCAGKQSSYVMGLKVHELSGKTVFNLFSVIYSLVVQKRIKNL